LGLARFWVERLILQLVAGMEVKMMLKLGLVVRWVGNRLSV
jgi:hypothetical protein